MRSHEKENVFPKGEVCGVYKGPFPKDEELGVRKHPSVPWSLYCGHYFIVNTRQSQDAFVPG